MQDEELRVSVLLTMQVALLGAVGPDVRKVLCRWDVSKIRIRAVFDGPIREADADVMSEVETEIMASFPSHDISLVCERLDFPQPILMHDGERAVFARIEVSN